MPVKAFAASEKNAELKPFEYELGPIGDDDVDISVEHCGICHTDLSMLENAWDMTTYPFVPGHEVTGTVATVGKRVAHVTVGDRVGLGWHANAVDLSGRRFRGWFWRRIRRELVAFWIEFRGENRYNSCMKRASRPFGC